MSILLNNRSRRLFCLYLVLGVSMSININDLLAQKKSVTSPYDSDWAEISGIIGNITGNYTTPKDDGGNTKYSSGALLGNGELGVVTGGDWHMMKLYVGKNAFWSGTSAGNIPISLNVGNITIKSAGSNGANSNYIVTQNIIDGHVDASLTIDSKAVQMKTWTADSKNLIVTELSTNSGQNVVIQVDLNVVNSDPTNQLGMALTAGVSGSLLWVQKESPIANVPFYCKAVMMTKIIGAITTVSTNAANTSSAVFTLTPGSKVILVTNVESVKDKPSPKSTVENYLNGLEESDISYFYTAHLAWWKEFWLRSYISLSDTELQKYWYGHLYAVACCSRTTSEAATGLFGNFVTCDKMSWWNDLKMNYNAENPFFGTFSSNHSDLIAPYITAIKNYAVIGRQRVANRSKLISSDISNKMPLGCRGMEFGGGITGFGTEECESNDYSMSSIATFAIVPIIWYWRYTQDDLFLKNTAYPLLLDCANFYEDYIGTKDANGIYNVYGATHERGSWDPVNWFTKNPSMDLGAAKYIFKTVIDASTRLGVDANRLTKWQDIYTNIAPFPTETYNGLNVLSPDPIHSISTVINKNSGTVHWTLWDNINFNTNSDLRNRIKNTLDVIGKWTDGNNYAMSPVIAIRAFYDPSLVINTIKSTALRSNLTISQSGGGIETSGIVEAIDNMMLQSHDGVVRIFPNWPKNLSAKFKRLRAQGAFLIDAQYSNSDIQSVSLFSEGGKICPVQNPWPLKNFKVRFVGGADVLTTQNGDIYTFNTIAGTTYELYSDNLLSSIPKIEELNFSLSPNPSSGKIDVKCSDIINEISITDIQGQVIFQTKTNSNNSSFILERNVTPGGIYFVQIKTPKGIGTQRLLFQ